MISGSNEQLQQELEYILLKPDCHRWWISKIQSGREDTLEERYAKKFCFKLWKNATEMYGMLHTAFRSSVFENSLLSYEMTDQFFYDFRFKGTATAGFGIHPIYLIYLYKEDLALNYLQWLICHKTKPNQTKQIWIAIASFFMAVSNGCFYFSVIHSCV